MHPFFGYNAVRAKAGGQPGGRGRRDLAGAVTPFCQKPGTKVIVCAAGTPR